MQLMSTPSQQTTELTHQYACQSPMGNLQEEYIEMATRPTELNLERK